MPMADSVRPSRKPQRYDLWWCVGGLDDDGPRGLALKVDEAETVWQAVDIFNAREPFLRHNPGAGVMAAFSPMGELLGILERKDAHPDAWDELPKGTFEENFLWAALTDDGVSDACPELADRNLWQEACW